MEARLPGRTITIGNATAVGKGPGPLCGGRGAYCAVARPGATGTDRAVYRGVNRGRMASLVRPQHRRGADGGDAGADDRAGHQMDWTFGWSPGSEAGWH